MIAKTTRLDRVDDQRTTRHFLKLAVECLPRKKHGDAWLLVEIMDRNRFMLNEQGCFIPKGHVLPVAGCHIFDLFCFLFCDDMKPHHHNHSPSTCPPPPPGFDIFVEELLAVTATDDLCALEEILKKYDKHSAVFAGKKKQQQ